MVIYLGIMISDDYIKQELEGKACFEFICAFVILKYF